MIDNTQEFNPISKDKDKPIVPMTEENPNSDRSKPSEPSKVVPQPRPTEDKPVKVTQKVIDGPEVYLSAAEAAEFDRSEDTKRRYFQQNIAPNFNPYKPGSEEYQKEEDRQKKFRYDQQNLLNDRIKNKPLPFRQPHVRKPQRFAVETV